MNDWSNRSNAVGNSTTHSNIRSIEQNKSCSVKKNWSVKKRVPLVTRHYSNRLYSFRNPSPTSRRDQQLRTYDEGIQRDFSSNVPSASTNSKLTINCKNKSNIPVIKWEIWIGQIKPKIVIIIRFDLFFALFVFADGQVGFVRYANHGALHGKCSSPANFAFAKPVPKHGIWPLYVI